MLPRNLDQWSEFVFSAGAYHGVEPVLIFAILEVETEGGASHLLDKPGPEGRGDNGHGHGLMQIDDRTWWDWIKQLDPETGKPLWMSPKANIYKGTEILASNLAIFAQDMIPAIAAYNGGPGHVRHALRDLTKVQGDIPREAKIKACDGVTANGNYVTRALAQIQRLTPMVQELTT